MPDVAGVSWTVILVHLIYGLPAILATIFAYLVRRDIKTPSGAPLGAVAERGHNAAVIAANTAIAVHQGQPADGNEGDGLPEPLTPKDA